MSLCCSALFCQSFSDLFSIPGPLPARQQESYLQCTTLVPFQLFSSPAPSMTTLDVVGVCSLVLLSSLSAPASKLRLPTAECSWPDVLSSALASRFPVCLAPHMSLKWHILCTVVLFSDCTTLAGTLVRSLPHGCHMAVLFRTARMLSEFLSGFSCFLRLLSSLWYF